MPRLPIAFAALALSIGCATPTDAEDSKPSAGGGYGGLSGIGSTGGVSSSGSGGQGAHPSGNGSSPGVGSWPGTGATESGGAAGTSAEGGAAGGAGEPAGGAGGSEAGGSGGTGGAGGTTSASNACCDTSTAPGCSDASVQACVCAKDGWCCSNEWDDVCVAEVDEFGCGTCTGGGGGSGGASSTCPTNGPPPGPYTMRFDTATLNCAANGTCASTQAKCFCQQDFDKLNVGPSHLIGVGSDMHKAEVWTAGNFQAVYVNELNVNIAAGGAQRAKDVMAKAKQDFPCGVPSWFIVNEISAGLWPGDASYRQFVIDFAKALKNTYGKKPIIAAPFATPGANAASWTELQKYAYIGAEVYLPGEKVNASGNSVAWCQAQYQASMNVYGKLGVPKSRLMLFEHFGGTKSGTGWGRAGSSTAGWHNAIKARSQAIKNVGFAGFLSYGWANNDMAASETDRLAFMATYNSISLP